MELLRNALDVIQSIDANDEFDAGEPLLELLNPLFNRLFGEVLDVPPDVRRESSHQKEEKRVFLQN